VLTGLTVNLIVVVFDCYLFGDLIVELIVVVEFGCLFDLNIFLVDFY
jgi:hypothetical protein